jgi:hypothetical protein
MQKFYLHFIRNDRTDAELSELAALTHMDQQQATLLKSNINWGDWDGSAATVAGIDIL